MARRDAIDRVLRGPAPTDSIGVSINFGDFIAKGLSWIRRRLRLLTMTEIYQGGIDAAPICSVSR